MTTGMTKPESMTTESPFSSQTTTGKSVDRKTAMDKEVEIQENGEPKHRSTPSLPKSFSMSFDNFDGCVHMAATSVVGLGRV